MMRTSTRSIVAAADVDRIHVDMQTHQQSHRRALRLATGKMRWVVRVAFDSHKQRCSCMLHTDVVRRCIGADECGL